MTPKPSAARVSDGLHIPSTVKGGGKTPDAANRHEYWIKRSWTRLWWCAINPNEALAEFDFHTVYRAWTRERLIAKLSKPPKPDPWEEIRV